MFIIVGSSILIEIDGFSLTSYELKVQGSLENTRASSPAYDRATVMMVQH